MFAQSATPPLRVIVKLSNGEELNGTIPAGQTASLASAISRDQPFLEVKNAEGATIHVSRPHIISIQQIKEEALG